MIGFFKENDRESIIDLWRRTFNDCEDYINNYINAFSENIIVCRLDGVVIGMVSLLDICVGEHKGGYIYALAVDEGYRKQGIATCILEFAQEKMLNEGCEFSVVVPEPYNCLERFYKNLGFNYELPLYKSVVLPNHSTEQVNITPVNKDEYYRIRKTQLGVVVHSKKIFEYVYEDLISDGFQFLKLQCGAFEGYCVCVSKDDCVIIKEALPLEYSDDVARCVCKALNIKNAILISNNGEQKSPFALLKIFDDKFNNKVYANLLLDSFGG